MRIPFREALAKIWLNSAVGPFEMAISTAVTIVGFGGIISGASLVPASIDATLPLWLIYAWSIGLAAGGVLTIAGRVIEYDRLEAAGLGLLIYGNVVYCAVLIISAHWPSALPTFVVMAAIVFGALMRIQVLSKARRLVIEANHHCDEGS